MTLKSDYCATNYVLQLVPKSSPAHLYLRDRILGAEEADKLRIAAAEDARRYLYNGCASFLGAMQSFHKQEAVWTITKMYYAVFYMMRAALCRSNFIIFHVRKGNSSTHTQFTLSILDGAKPELTPDFPSTHKLVAKVFKDSGYPAFMTGLQVGGDDPIQWLLQQREYWQYRCGRFPDPEYPDALAALDPAKLSLLLETYSGDNTGAYLSDPAHAMVALPFRLLDWSMAAASFLMKGIVDQEDVNHLRRQCRISKQKLSAVDRLLGS